MQDDPTDHTICADVERFTICDEGSANWLLRKLGNIAAEQARVRAQATTILKTLESDASSLRFLYERQLNEFVRRQLDARHGTGRTLRLIQGTCSFRTVPAHLRVQDPSEAIRCADAAGIPCIVVRRELDGAAYLCEAEAALQSTGELLPGVELIAERESFAIRFGGRERDDGFSNDWGAGIGTTGEQLA